MVMKLVLIRGSYTLSPRIKYQSFRLIITNVSSYLSRLLSGWNYQPYRLFSMTSSIKLRDYQSAVSDLNNFQSNASIITELNLNRAKIFQLSLPEMRVYLNLLGYQPDDLNVLNLIHIAGTKGKGSTSAYCQSILRNYPGRLLKTGLYTSPHMMEVRERIRIDGHPLSPSKFAEYFYYCYDRLVGVKASQANPHLPGPQYFRFLTLLAFHCFMQERVDVAILEVGIGGEYDSTNLITRPIVCGITHLGLDHTNLLGTTIPEIAWHKAGILKPGALGVTIPGQNVEAMRVLNERAVERQCSLDLAKPLDQFDNFAGLKLGLGGVHQIENASLAVSICTKWIQQKFPNQDERITDTLPEYICEGLISTRWPGRSHRYEDKLGFVWYLDGAHTTSSIQACIEWFVTARDAASKPYLLFNPANGRDGKTFLKLLHAQAQHHNIDFQAVVFCPNLIYTEETLDADSFNNTIIKDDRLTLQHELAATWQLLEHSTTMLPNISVQPSIQSAVHWIQHYHTTHNPHLPSNILVTGSLHLVGGAMAALGHEVI